MPPSGFRDEHRSSGLRRNGYRHHAASIMINRLDEALRRLLSFYHSLRATQTDRVTGRGPLMIRDRSLDSLCSMSVRATRGCGSCAGGNAVQAAN
jgi:hypothetical protein